jgi:glycosyltransferase involved in cell wall biosynthesis
MTRVAFFAHRLAPTDPTGLVRYTVELVRALAPLSVDGQPTEWLVCSTREQTSPDWLPAGVTACVVPGPRRLVRLSWATIRWPRFESLTRGVDLLHVTTPVVPVPTTAPLVVTIHDLLPLHHPEWYTRRERWLGGATFAHAARVAAAVITPSKVVADDVAATLGVGPERVTVVPEGVDHSFAARVPAEVIDATCRRLGVVPGRFLLFIGAIGPRKNLPVVLEALATVRPRHPDLQLLAVGPISAQSTPTLDQAQALGFDRDRCFPGFVADADLRAVLAGARALVHPASYEGFGLTPLEAMAAGTAVISSDAGSLPEVVGDAGLRVPPDDPTAWAEAIDRIAGDDGLRADLIAAGRARAAQFTWERAAAETLTVYRRVLR